MRALFVALLVCLLGAGAYGLWTLLELRAQTAPPTPSAFVQATWSVYRFGPGHRAHVGQLSLDCQACHQTQTDGKFDRPGPAACVSCHEPRAHIEHALVDVDSHGHRLTDDAGARGERVSDCIACHGFGPDPEKQPDDCLTCHARAKGHTPAIVNHADVDCKNCHQVHDNRIAPLKCSECHSVEAHHGASEGPPEQTCLTCHRAHDRAAPAVESCRTCHTTEHAKPQGEHAVAAASIPASASFEGHSCTGCHTPHTFPRDGATMCSSCHTEVHVLEGKGHASCTACHAPHAVRESVAANVCARCHDDVALKHSPKIDLHAACTSCHAPHPSSQKLTSVHAASGACASCHASVGHAGNQAHAGGMACTSCHKPHGFALEHDQSACSACHAPQIKLTAGNPGHASCTGCHQNLPHGAELGPKSCTSCHTDVHAREGHARCTNCHEPHQGAPNGKVCADCHANEAHQGIHAAKQLRCTQCHDQHTTQLGAGVASCDACHKKSALPGLHEVPQHAAACTSCHAPHGAELPGARATCLACHKDRQDHQPEAKRCEGCHQFVPAAHGRRAP